DKPSASRGKPIFNKYCASCHAEINRSDPKRRVVAQMTRVSSVGTDPKMAENSTTFKGYSGILRDMYVDTGVGKILLQDKDPVAALLTMATRNAITSQDPDKWKIVGLLERFYDFGITFFDNEVQVSLKRGDYEPDTTVNPFASLSAYKARSLNGIWATAPYLHNGSVPTLYDLLLPAEDRPKNFKVGAREFDPVHVGFKSKGYDGFRFRTSVPGNHNSGHEYAAGRTPQANGKKLPALNKAQRWDLLEYLKTL
ncbi:MAG: di-heme-cytochrome C peroxidase, partial [Mariprofundaceae bacterium]